MVTRRLTRSRPALAAAAQLAALLLATPARAQAQQPADPYADPALAAQRHAPAVPQPALAPTPPPAAPPPAAVAPPPRQLPRETWGATPEIHHSPVSTSNPGEPISITATIEHPELVRHVAVVYRTGVGAVRSTPMLRGGGGYVAVIPAEDVAPPGLAYTIEVERVDGARFAAFASRAELQPIVVLGDPADARERALDARLGGRRSVVNASAELVRFGRTTSDVAIACSPGSDPTCANGKIKPSVIDQYWRMEAGYTYRPLGTVAEFSLRGGVVRGRSLVQQGSYDPSKYDVGLNYGAAMVRFRFADTWHLEWELLTSITEIGFSVGTGGALLIGDPYGTKLTVGFETIGIASGTYFGSRFYTRVDVVANDRMTVAPIVEVTDMPHAEIFGVRLLGEVGFALGGGFGAAVRGGYQARRWTEGGPGVGVNLSLAF